MTFKVKRKQKKVPYDVNKVLAVRSEITDLRIATALAKGKDKQKLKRALKRNEEIYSEYLK